jgi:hypothetical protein
VSADLDQATHALLTPSQRIIDRHGNDGTNRCRYCRLPWPCLELDAVIEAPDLVLRAHVAARNQPTDPVRQTPGPLR